MGENESWKLISMTLNSRMFPIGVSWSSLSRYVLSGQQLLFFFFWTIHFWSFFHVAFIMKPCQSCIKPLFSFLFFANFYRFQKATMSQNVSARQEDLTEAQLTWYCGFWLRFSLCPVSGSKLRLPGSQNWATQGTLPALQTENSVADFHWHPRDPDLYVCFSQICTTTYSEATEWTKFAFDARWFAGLNHECRWVRASYSSTPLSNNPAVV